MDKQIRSNLIIMISILMIGLVASFLFIGNFMRSVNEASDKETLIYVLETTEQMNYSLQSRIDDTWSQLNMAKQTLLHIGDDAKAVIDYLSAMCDDAAMETIFLLSDRGDYISNNGDYGNWNISEELLALFTEGETVCMLRQNVSAGDMLSFAIPIQGITINGIYMEYMIAEYRLDTFMDVLSLKSYGGQGVACVVDNKGRCLFHSGNMLPFGSNSYYFFSMLQDFEFERNPDIASKEELRQQMVSGGKGAVYVTGNDNTYAVSFVPVGIMDWNLVLLVGQEALSTGRESYVQKMAEMSIGVVLFIIVICAIAYLIATWILKRRTTQQLSNRERLINILSNDTMGAYILVDEKTMLCTYVSPGISSVLGLDVTMFINAPFEKVVDAIHSPVLEESLAQWNRMEILEVQRFVFFHPKTGESKYLRCRFFPSTDGELVVTLMDETADAKKEKVLQDAITAARSANEAKSNFLSNISHDIRTPMNTIVGLAVLLEREVDKNDKVREYTDKLGVASRHMLGLINDVLDMSKIESGKTILNMERFRLSVLLEELSVVIQPQAKAKKQKFTIIDEDLRPDCLVGDKMHISQILSNLLSNAVKYTQEDGRIVLTVTQLSLDERGYVRLRFEVEDNGMGMSADFLENIFEPFIRENTSTVSGIQGTGLGMAITKSLVELMGGTITVKSTVGEGSIFTVELELRTAKKEIEVQARDVGVRESKEKNISIEGLNFLLAEDNAINAEIMTELLAMEGARCDRAVNGRRVVEMFEAASNGTYDVILMDIQMPEMDGYAAAWAIRNSNHPEGASIPIIAMTANAFAEDVQKALEAGMNEHVAKPVNMNLLCATVVRLLEERK